MKEISHNERLSIIKILETIDDCKCIVLINFLENTLKDKKVKNYEKNI